MFGIEYKTTDGRVFKIFNDLNDAQAEANSIAHNGNEVTVFDYDKDSKEFIEFYTIYKQEDKNMKVDLI